MLVSWDKVLSLVDYNLKKEIIPLAVFPDWIENIFPWELDPNKYFLTWQYSNGKYFLKKGDVSEIQKNFKNWQKSENHFNVFSKFPELQPFFAPYEKIYAQNALYLSKKDQTLLPEKTPDQKIKTTHFQNVKNSSAFYENRFLFAYPYAMPSFLGDPSVGLFAVPFVDEIERHFAQIFLNYNFYLKKPGGSLSYIHNRILDGFSISLFSGPFFNGFYDDIIGNKTYRTLNYLQQSGMNVSTAWRKRSYALLLKAHFSLTFLEPYPSFPVAPTSVGVQKTLLASIKTTASFPLFKKSFILEDQYKSKNLYSHWNNLLNIKVEKLNSLDTPKDSLKKNVEKIDSLTVSASILSQMSVLRQKWSLFATVSTTQGQERFHKKEIYSPYQESFFEERQSLNFMRYSFLGGPSVFNLRSGDWSYTNLLTYRFPLLPSFEKLFLIAFLENLESFVSLETGGVFENQNLTTDPITTVRVGTSLSADMKGFQIYPSLVYEQILNTKNWSILMQIGFENVF